MQLAIKNTLKRRCPVCKIKMKPKLIGPVEIDICYKCGGTWYDWGEIEAILKTKRNLLHYVPLEHTNIIESTHNCADCKHTMKRLSANEIFPFDIDFCEKEHGIWLDTGELKKIKTYLPKFQYSFKKRDDEKEKEKLNQIAQNRLQSVSRKKIDMSNYHETEESIGFKSFSSLSAPQKIIGILGLPVESGKFYEKTSWVNLLVIAVNITIFILCIFAWDYKSIILNFGFIPNKIQASLFPYGITFLTSMFLHGGLLHLLGNMYFLFVVGDDVEKKYGHLKYLFFYIAGGIIASLISLLANKSPNIPHIGASGAISAVMGAYTFLCHNKRFYFFSIFLIIIGMVFSVSVFLYLLFWFLIQLMSIKLGNPHIGYLAHAAGFFFGFFFAPVLLRKEEKLLR